MNREEIKIAMAWVILAAATIAAWYVIFQLLIYVISLY
jgi:hypothetical protein